MFGIGSTELLVILLVALVVLGPKSLASVAHTLGKAMGEFRRVSTEFQRTLNTEIAFEEHSKKKKEAEEELFGEEKGGDAAAKTAEAPAPSSASPAPVAASAPTPTGTVNDAQALAPQEGAETVAPPSPESSGEKA